MNRRTRETMLEELEALIGDEAVPNVGVPWERVQKALADLPLEVLNTLVYRIGSVEVAAFENATLQQEIA